MDSAPITSLPTKIIGIGKKLAPIGGVLHGLLGAPIMHGGGFEGAPNWIWNRLNGIGDAGSGQPPSKGLLQGHIGNPLTTTTMAMTMPEAYPIIPGAAAALFGWVLESVGGKIDGPGATSTIVSGIGTIFKKYGVAACLGGIVAGWLYLTPWNPGGGTQQTMGAGYTGGVQRTTQGPGTTNTFWQVRAAANIRESTGPVDIYPT